MQAVVLVGGEGTRLRPLTRSVPKGAVPLVDRPFLRYIVDWLARHGVEEVILAIGFLAGPLREALGAKVPGGPEIRYVEEPERRGTAGAIKFAEPFLDERFLALNGDVLTDLDLSALIRRHEAAGAVGTLALHPVDDPSAYGLVRRAEDGEITEFLEKPDPAEIDTDEISAGAYVLERSVLDLVPPDGEVSIEREVFPRLVGNGLFAERLEGYWMDIGTPERYLRASWDILERRVETDAAKLLDERGRHVADASRIAEDASVEDSVFVSESVAVGEAARLGPRVVLAAGCDVGPGARIEESVIHAGSAVGAGAEVRGSILAPRTRVGEGAVIEPGCVVGEAGVIGGGSRLAAGTMVDRGEEVR